MKKQLLFLITLLLAITPACKQKNKPHLAGANGAIAAGSILTAAGTAGVPLATVTAIGVCALSGGAAIVPSVASLLILPVGLLIIGIPLIIYGVKKRKAKIRRFKEQQKLEIATQEKQAAEENLSQKD
jgi:hypothetical protein